MNNTPSNAINVVATTELCSNSNKGYPYAVSFKLDPRTGRVSNLQEKGGGPCFPRPYLFLDLMAQVIEVQEDLAEGARFVSNPARHGGSHPAIQVASGKRYRLDHEVDGSWLEIHDLLELASYWSQHSEYYPGTWRFWVQI